MGQDPEPLQVTDSGVHRRRTRGKDSLPGEMGGHRVTDGTPVQGDEVRGETTGGRSTRGRRGVDEADVVFRAVGGRETTRRDPTAVFPLGEVPVGPTSRDHSRPRGR